MAGSQEAMGLYEAAELFGMTRTNFNMHRQRYSEPGQCPEPTAQLKCGPIWTGSELKALKAWQKEAAKLSTARAKVKAQKSAAVAKKAAAVAKKSPSTKPAAKPSAAKKPNTSPTKKSVGKIPAIFGKKKS